MLHITTTDNNCTKNLSDLIDKSEENNFSLSHYAELTNIANIPLSELCEKNKNLLVFPDNVGKSYGSIGDEVIFEMSGSFDFRAGFDSTQPAHENQYIKIKTGNLMGFIGTKSSQIQITSRFAPAVSTTSTGSGQASSITTQFQFLTRSTSIWKTESGARICIKLFRTCTQ